MEKLLEDAGVTKTKIFLASEVVDDAVVMKLINAIPKVLGMSVKEALSAFAKYWIHKFAPKWFFFYYAKAKTAKDFLLMMDEVHQVEARKVRSGERVNPPRFKYEWLNDKTLIMHYISRRNLIDLAVMLVKEVGNYYRTPLMVSKIGNNKIKVVFLR